MIEQLQIKNFKSIKDLEISCKRKNIFIGEPNTGKSNILESLGVLSTNFAALSELVRFESMANLFYDDDLENTIEIRFNQEFYELRYHEGTFIGDYGYSEGNIDVSERLVLKCDFQGPKEKTNVDSFDKFKFFRFKVRSDFPNLDANFLKPPSGDNLLAILKSHKKLKSIVADIFKKYGFRIVLKPQENKIEIQKEVEDVIISYPYSLVSDTLQRLVFYLAAIETNKNSVLIFEEPEAHAFPYYTKYLSERIASDKSNQYFITTHNPYFLDSIIEKAPKDDVAVFITYFEDYQTKIKALSQSELEELMEADVFLGIERFLESEE